MLSEELYEKGVATMGAMLGPEWIEQNRKRHEAALEAGTEDRVDFATMILYGFMFHRPQLAKRDRAIVMLTSDVVQNCPPAAFQSHLQIAVSCGVTRDEIDEIIFQLTQYCGFPRAREASIMVGKFFAAREQSKR